MRFHLFTSAPLAIGGQLPAMPVEHRIRLLDVLCAAGFAAILYFAALATF